MQNAVIVRNAYNKTVFKIINTLKDKQRFECEPEHIIKEKMPVKNKKQQILNYLNIKYAKAIKNKLLDRTVQHTLQVMNVK